LAALVRVELLSTVLCVTIDASVISFAAQHLAASRCIVCATVVVVRAALAFFVAFCESVALLAFGFATSEPFVRPEKNSFVLSVRHVDDSIHAFRFFPTQSRYFQLFCRFPIFHPLNDFGHLESISIIVVNAICLIFRRCNYPYPFTIQE